MSASMPHPCKVCGTTDATFLVAEPEWARGYYCHDCWQARRDPEPCQAPAQRVERMAEPSDGGRDTSPYAPWQ